MADICKKLQDNIYKIFIGILLVCFLPVLFCVVLIGNYMDYYAGMKIDLWLPEQVLSIIALIGLAFCIFLFWKCSAWQLTRRANWTMNCALAGLFIILYFINIQVAKEIAFYLPWDIGVVRMESYNVAYEIPLGYHYYFSVFSNNIPILYILGRLYRKAAEMQNYPYNYDFICIQVNCALISIAGFFSCLTVKKITKKLMPTVAVFLLYLALVGISPWKIAPYTDTYGLIFPVMCIYFYICYRHAKKTWCKCICILLSLVFGMWGSFVKPNLYIIIIALMLNELLCLFADYKKNWKFLMVEAVLVLALLWGNKAYLGHIIEEIGFDFNSEIEAGWQHYFYMGLNEGTGGGYSAEDTAMFGEFDYSRSDRIHAELERAWGRLKGRGFFGSVYFYLKKMVMTFNDGVFGWRTEVWEAEPYPEGLASNTIWTLRLRSIYCGDTMEDFKAECYNLFCQLVWIFCIIGIPGICLCRKEKREEYGILILSFLGVFFYQMLFEARARYLFVFLPVILPTAICGIQEYTRCMVEAIQKKKS